MLYSARLYYLQKTIDQEIEIRHLNAKEFPGLLYDLTLQKKFYLKAKPVCGNHVKSGLLLLYYDRALR